MNEKQPRWIRSAVVAGALYLIAGLVFAELAKSAASPALRTTWRAAAYLISAIVFAVHIRHERMRRGRPPVATALHVSIGAALGACALALAANLHALSTPSANRGRLGLALVAWPLLTGVPAFIVGLVAASILKRSTDSASPP
jgi:4-amino-4-deoxy-L-arabinose transferase-like glycosyltransferase